MWHQQAKRRELLRKIEKLEKKETQQRERESKVTKERQRKEEEDKMKNGKTPEQKEAESQSAPKVEVFSTMKKWYRGKQREKITEAISETYEKERTIQHSSKKVYLYTLTKRFLQVSLASWSYHTTNVSCVLSSPTSS